MSRALIIFNHISPPQVANLTHAIPVLEKAGHSLLPVECFGAWPKHGWSAKDARRPVGWACLYPDRVRANRTGIFLRVVRLVRRERIDVVVLNGWHEPVSWLMALAKTRLAVRLVVMSDTTETDRRRRRSAEAAKRAFLRRIDAVFTAGTRQVRYLERLGFPRDRARDGVYVVENERFMSCPRPGPPPGRSDPVVIGTAARLVSVKNLNTSLEAVSEVARDQGVSIRWRLAGKGPLEEPLRARAAALGCPVDFAGLVPYREIPRFYAGLDLYWQPSLSEPWGMVVNEAMAAGLPILLSDRCGCADDLVTPENGWIHGIDREDLQAGLRQALTQRRAWTEMGARSRALIAGWGHERFSRGLLESVQIALDHGAS